MPLSVAGMGDIVYWKDGREVYDSVNVIYRYSDGVKINYESLISNRFNGMEDQILGNSGTMDLTKGLYYLENDNSLSGIQQLLAQIKEKAFEAIPAAGPSWRSETKKEYPPHSIVEGRVYVNPGQSTVGVDKDGSDVILSSFCWREGQGCGRGGLLRYSALPACQPGHGGGQDGHFPGRIQDPIYEILRQHKQGKNSL